VNEGEDNADFEQKNATEKMGDHKQKGKQDCCLKRQKEVPPRVGTIIFKKKKKREEPTSFQSESPMIGPLMISRAGYVLRKYRQDT